jgi:hypothetical protein
MARSSACHDGTGRQVLDKKGMSEVKLRSLGGVLAAVLVLSQSGCGGKYKPVPVEGIVTLDGKPVEAATVLFFREGGAGRPASGLTDAQGIFHMTTFREDDGALPGDYRVVVTKSPGREAPTDERPGEDKEAAEHHRGIIGIENRKKTVLPSAYGDESTTMLRCRVPADGRVTVELQSAP